LAGESKLRTVSILKSSVVNFGIGMEIVTKSSSLCGQVLFNVLDVTFMVQRSGHLEVNFLALIEGGHFSLVEERVAHQVIKESGHKRLYKSSKM
jgi:hypothetical protein